MHAFVGGRCRPDRVDFAKPRIVRVCDGVESVSETHALANDIVAAAINIVAGVHAGEADASSARSDSLPLPLRRQLPHQRDSGDLGAEDRVAHDRRQRRHGVAFSLVLNAPRRFVSHLVFTHQR